ncbi:DUF3631 domain-containing protein, partial [Frankia sp. EI5c]|uniref:DUF3631 domain-containing protein n=1 Tax=Frankia sp. EI5c TaxID=683316 RepID=UPI001F5B98D5
EYGIRSANIRFPDGTQAKGYDRAAFTDAWARYCPPEDLPTEVPSHPSQASPRWSERDGYPPWDGSIRPTNTTRPSLTSVGTLGTDGTDTPPDPVTGGRRTA